MKKFFHYFVARKFLGILLIASLSYGGYYAYKKITDTSGLPRYVTALAEKGTLIASVTGSGQVSALNQVDIKPKVSGEVISVYVGNGDSVKQGALLVQLDGTDAQKAVRDAEVALETAKLSYEKLVAPADELSLLQWNNTIEKAKESKDTAVSNLQKTYDEGFNNVSNTFLEMPSIITGLKDLLYSTDNSLGGQIGQMNIDYYTSYAQMNETVPGKAEQYKNEVNEKYLAARESYDETFLAYKAASRNSDTETIESLIVKTYDAVKKLADAIKSSNNLIQLYKDQSSLRNITAKPLADTHLSTLSAYTGKTNGYLTSLLGSTNSITSNKNTIINSDRTIAENTLSYEKFKAGADVLDIRNAKITISQKENALSDARETLAEYSIRAPFDGTVAKVNVKKLDEAGNGTSVVTFVTNQQMAEISLNEIDAAKVKVDQKVTLTFDAVEDLTITGKVNDVDTVGTVSQGVVTYTVKIAFDTQDERVKSGMTVNASIITDVKTDVLLVPNSAVKMNGETYYIETFNPPISATDPAGTISKVPPTNKTVTVGIANDTQTEILSGLSEDEQIVERTATGASGNTTQTRTSMNGSARSIFGGIGGGPGR